MDARLVVGVSGASGAPLALRLLLLAQECGLGVELIVTPGGARTLREECGLGPEDLAQYAEAVYDCADLAAPPSSGSHPTLGMAVMPCSMKTLAGIASGYSENLLLRAADVTLKEGRKLVLAVREAPLSAVHLRNMYELARFGAVLFPPVPPWYAKPQSLEEAERQIAARILAQFGVEAPGAPCWG